MSFETARNVLRSNDAKTSQILFNHLDGGLRGLREAILDHASGDQPPVH